MNQNSDIIIGGIYRRSRPSTEVMKSEFNQLHHKILSAVEPETNVVLLGDLNLDHNNPEHILTKEASDLLAVTETANMRHMPNQISTWKSYGFHKVCNCTTLDYSCEKRQRTSCIDNAYISLEAQANLKVLEDAFTDHFPLLIELKTGPIKRSESVWKRDISKIKAFELEAALCSEDWSLSMSLMILTLSLKKFFQMSMHHWIRKHL